MKSIIKKTIYAGLGVMSDGAKAVRDLGRQLARKADVSEAEGERIARLLRVRSIAAIKSIRKNLDADVTKAADSIHRLMRDSEREKTRKSKPAVSENRFRRRKAD